jgi:hypothetical protein
VLQNSEMAAIELASLNQGPAWVSWNNKRTANLDDILYQNIVACEYYQQIKLSVLDIDGIVDEIYNQVEHLGNNNLIFFCFLFVLLKSEISKTLPFFHLC